MTNETTFETEAIETPIFEEAMVEETLEAPTHETEIENTVDEDKSSRGTDIAIGAAVALIGVYVGYKTYKFGFKYYQEKIKPALQKKIAEDEKAADIVVDEEGNVEN